MNQEPEQRIESWKGIADYFRRGVRTVQRWEREEGLPVHRLQHDKLGSVFAIPAELDQWRNRRLVAARIPESPDREVIVLPFSDFSREQDQAYFCEGVAEEIRGVLSRVKGLRVASRLASHRYRLKGIPDEGAVLAGSVRKAGERLKIGVELTEDGDSLWTESYDRKLGDVFLIQEEIARNAAHALQVNWQEKGLAPTRDIEAYDLYLHGRDAYYHYGPHDVRCAIVYFERALERDPQYVLAQAGLADCWAYLYLNAERSADNLARADAASRKAVELGPDSAQALASRALAMSLHGEDADSLFERAIAIDPNLYEAHYFYARHAFTQGKSEKAVRLYEEAIRIRPEDHQAPRLLAQSYDDLGQPEKGIAARRHGIECAEQHLELHPDDARALYMAANGLAALGEKERARAWAERALSLRPDDSMLLYNVGCIYSMLGLIEEALAILEKAVERGLRHREWYEHDSNLDALRGEPRFARLLAGLAASSARQAAESNC